jgi:proton-translocating NADH-quinone oxidoreductase chain M
MFLFEIYIFLFFYIFVISFVFFFFFNYIRLFAYYSFSFIFILTWLLLLFYNKSIFWFQLIIKFYTINYLQISYILGIDNISVFFLIICSFLILICYLIYWFLSYKISLYSAVLMFSLFTLLNTFASLDMFIFFIYYESIVIPMFLLISIWGSRSRRVYASYLLLSYTILGSVFILTSILYIYNNIGSSSFIYIYNINFFTDKLIIIFMCFFIGFGIKVPIMPLHIWLPEAHVEAPTPGSVILAGIILKLGIFALFRLLFFFFFNIEKDVIFFICIVSYIGFLFSSQIAMSQIDLKKVIAYSSVAHMNFALLGLFSESILALSGLFYLMLGHAITSSALFLGIGVLYDRYKTRLIPYYGSLVLFMPIFSTIYFVFILANFGFPGTFNFVGEFLILNGLFSISTTLFFFSSIPLILSLIYSLFLFTRVFFGPIYNNFIRYYSEMILLEFVVLFLLILVSIVGAFCPMCILQIVV